MSGENQIGISEDFKIAVQAALERFRLNEEEKNYEFPSALSKHERKFVHELCKEYGLKSKSHGKGANRSLTMSKKELVSRGHDLPPIKLKPKTQQYINGLLSHQPLMEREKNDLVPRTERGSQADVSVKESRKLLFKQPNIQNFIPPEANTEPFEYFKQSLPIYHMREQVIKSIDENRVVLILGDTGSGKSTQVPQMLLEEFASKKKKCNIYVTQPRRLSAIALAERISTERGELCGKAVGYQIRLEQKLSRETLLTFCTTGILLRTLMSGDDISHVTHIIVDEVHERDKFTDFLLIALRDLLFKQSHLKLILMSATLNLPLFTEYFGNCPVISVPGRMFDVKEYFLEDILSWTSYSTDMMKMAEVRLNKQKESQEALAKWCENILPQSEPKTITEDTETTAKMDELIENAFQHGKREAIDEIIGLVTEEKVSVDYQHSLTTVSGLMTAAARGWMTSVESLLRLGANVHLQTVNGWKALDFAHHYRSAEIAEWLSAFEIAEMGDDDQSEADNASVDEAQSKLLKIYHYSFNDDKVDTDLIFTLAFKIHTEKPMGAILVFLPGYDDILSLKDKIEGSDVFIPYSYKLFLLHSSISTHDQNKVFDTMPDGVRKLILSTNIAETSITIGDVSYVIDSGKVKEQLFDAVSNTNCLRTNWISQTSAVQRKGRAGRVRAGECYRLFSRSRFSNMQKYQTAEILRCPLEELCLHTKLLAPITSSIADFLSKAVEPPPQLVIKNAVNVLKQMDALDKFEDLTDLGCHLAELPVPPHCGKMVLMSVILKCLDPILTIASFLSYKEPFLLPTTGEGKRKLASIKEKFAKDSFSDHIAYLEFYQGYLNAKENRQERIFCFQNNFSYAVMQIVDGTRDHLKRHLSAIGFIGQDYDVAEINANSDKWPVIRAVLVSALFPKLAIVDKTNGAISTRLEKRVRCHPSSVLNSSSQVNSKSHKDIVRNLPYNWLIFDEMTRFNTLALVKCCSVVTSFSVALMAGPSRLLPHQYHFEADPELESDDEEECSNDEEKRTNWKPSSNFRFSIDDWLNLYLDNGNASLIVNIRQKFHALVVRKLKTCGKSALHGDDQVVNTIVQALCSEDQASSSIPINSLSRMKLAPPGRKSNFRSDRNESSSSSEERNSSTPGIGGSSSRSSISSSPCLTPDVAATAGQTVRYFVLKPADATLIDTSLATGFWYASHGTKRVLDNAYKQSSGSVILFISVQGSGHFQGYARMTSASLNDLGKTKFAIEWLKRREVHFHEVNHLINPWNDNKNIKISRDGQEIEPSTAQELIEVIERGNEKSRYPKGRSSRRGKKFIS